MHGAYKYILSVKSNEVPADNNKYRKLNGVCLYYNR